MPKRMHWAPCITLPTAALLAAVLLAAWLPSRSAVDARIFMPQIPNLWINGPGVVTGKVFDASTRTNISGATVCIGTVCDVTDLQGAYTLNDILAGWRTASASALDYIPLDEGLYVLGQQAVVQDFALSPPTDIGDIYMRMVLTWDPTTSWPPLNTPNDLDANLWLEAPNPPTRITSPPDPSKCTTFPNACLEVDEQNGFGPETIVIRLLENTTYHYGVLNYNSANEGVPPIMQLDVTVRLYDDTGLVQEFHVPGSGEGDFWYVFSMVSDGTTAYLQTQDCITGEPPLDTVPSCPGAAAAPIIPVARLPK